jgi:hypothetical protein
VRHVLHLLIFASLLSLFFAFLLGGRRPNWRAAVKLWLSVVGGALVLGLLMAPFSG